MKISDNPLIQLTYCMNVHPGKNWAENFAAIREYATRVRQQVAPNKPFGLGMRLSRVAADELATPMQMQALKQFLTEQNMYVFTINGFPYSEFHSAGVKTSVYRPDWRDKSRLEYTNTLCLILAQLLPPGVSGSISTVPCSYREWIHSENDRVQMAENLAAAALHAEHVSLQFDRDIHIGLEPEPDCYLETTEDVIRFFKEDLYGYGVAFLEDAGMSAETAQLILKRRMGVCFDTCHIALQFENLNKSLWLLQDAGIKISKIQISSALCASDTADSRNQLQKFCDPVYLHQVKEQDDSGNIIALGDLENAISLENYSGNEWRIHFHVPLYFEVNGVLSSTAFLLSPEFFRDAIDCGVSHFEIETYTFDVLPQELRAEGVVGSIIREYRWVRHILDRMPQRPSE